MELKAMELVSRYLQAVKTWLPEQQANDIADELSSDIRSQIEDRETSLGRKLNDGDIETLLKQRGRPELVAIPFWPAESVSILTPVHRYIRKLVFACYLAPWLLAFFLYWAFEQHRPSWLSVIGSLSAQMWLLTFLALGTERLILSSKRKWLENWSPRKLPSAEKLAQ